MPIKAAVPFLSENSEACFKHFSALVAATPADALEAYNADPDIVRVNVVRAVDAVREHFNHVAKALPLVNIAELQELPSLALALGFGADKVFTAASRQEIKARQATLRPARSLTLRYLEIVGELAIIPAEPVQNIRAGKGPLDEARDGVAVVATFNEYEKKLDGKHPFTAEYLTKLAEDGNWLIKALLPTGAKPGKAGTNPDALVRDQLWTEVVRRYDVLYQAGMVIWGRRKVDAHLPALQTRVVAAAKAEPVVAAPKAERVVPAVAPAAGDKTPA
jgi:hypothetical protein